MGLSQRDSAHPLEWRSLVLRNASLNFRQRNHYSVLRNLKRLEALYKATPEDPERGRLESSICQCLNTIAFRLCDELRFDECLDLCACIKDILLCKALRFRNRKLQAPSDNTSWSSLTGVLSECKWKMPVSKTDAVMPVGEMIFRFFKAQKQIRWRLIDYADNYTTEAENVLTNLLDDGTSLLCLLKRIENPAYDSLYALINKWHNNILRDSDEYYFWKLSLINEVFSGNSNERTILYCLDHHYKTTLLSKPSNYEDSEFQYACEVERKYLRYLASLNSFKSISTKRDPEPLLSISHRR